MKTLRELKKATAAHLKKIDEAIADFIDQDLDKLNPVHKMMLDWLRNNNYLKDGMIVVVLKDKKPQCYFRISTPQVPIFKANVLWIAETNHVEVEFQTFLYNQTGKLYGNVWCDFSKLPLRYDIGMNELTDTLKF